MPRKRPSFYWSDDDLALLVQMAQAQEPTRRIARALGRTPKAVRNKASAMGLALTAYDFGRRAPRIRRAAGMMPSIEGDEAPRAVRVTVDFDVSALTREERALLMARLQGLDGPRELVIPKAYDRAAAEAARAATREASRGALGWKKGREPGPPSDAISRKQMRRLKREAKLAGWQERHFPRPTTTDELAPAVARYLEARRHQRMGTLPAPLTGKFGEE